MPENDTENAAGASEPSESAKDADEDTAVASDEEKPTKGVARAISGFAAHMEGLKHSERYVMPVLIDAVKKFHKEFEEFLEKDNIPKREEDNKTIFSIPLANVQTFKEIQKKMQSSQAAIHQTPQALFVALVSCYDAYLGQLLRELFYIRSEMLNASNRTFTFQDLVKFDDINDAREYLIEKEVESVIRESHVKQFSWIEGKFDIPLTKGLQCWADFVELTERRNLFVHTDGRVSSQYLDVCKSHGVKFEKDLQAGDRLGINKEYFQKAYNCLFEIGIKLGHVLWRKLVPDDLEYADGKLNAIFFSLLKEEEFLLAKPLLEFAVNVLKRHASSMTRRIFVVNLAISYKWGDEPDKCKALLDKEDWSDCGDHFKLAELVLSDDFAAAKELMRDLGKDAKGIGREGYETWPLFRDFRKSQEFRECYGDIFGEQFELESVEPSDGDEAESAPNVQDAEDETDTASLANQKNAENRNDDAI